MILCFDGVKVRIKWQYKVEIYLKEVENTAKEILILKGENVINDIPSLIKLYNTN